MVDILGKGIKEVIKVVIQATATTTFTEDIKALMYPKIVEDTNQVTETIKVDGLQLVQDGLETMGDHHQVGNRRVIIKVLLAIKDGTVVKADTPTDGTEEIK